ncbi:hypothetical protein V6N13_087306 [Hibiscus sabdariffa]|uniref:Uncharacterized protein n=1 Tax=Hibiscus sabdariffa TaxID=183260 RepID=A0ABR2FVX2_9ROSI
MAPSFPEAADIPWQVDLNLAGNVERSGVWFKICKEESQRIHNDEANPVVRMGSVLVRDSQYKHKHPHEEEAYQLEGKSSNNID